MARPVRLKSHSVTIRAPRELVFQMTSSFGRGRINGDQGESSTVLERTDDAVLAEFKTRAGPFRVTTVERVTLEPPGRLTFEHVSGPLPYPREEFAFREVPQGTELEHSGEFVWFAAPLIGWGRESCWSSGRSSTWWSATWRRSRPRRRPGRSEATCLG